MALDEAECACCGRTEYEEPIVTTDIWIGNRMHLGFPMDCADEYRQKILILDFRTVWVYCSEKCFEQDGGGYGESVGFDDSDLPEIDLDQDEWSDEIPDRFNFTESDKRFFGEIYRYHPSDPQDKTINPDRER